MNRILAKFHGGLTRLFQRINDRGDIIAHELQVGGHWTIPIAQRSMVNTHEFHTRIGSHLGGKVLVDSFAHQHGRDAGSADGIFQGCDFPRGRRSIGTERGCDRSQLCKTVFVGKIAKHRMI